MAFITVSFHKIITKPLPLPLLNKPAIDNILTNNFLNAEFSSGIIKTDVSDHFAIFFSFQISSKANKTEYISITKRDLSKNNIDKFRQTLKLTNWDEVLLSKEANLAFNIFHNQFTTVFDNICPVKEVKVKSKNVLNPWFDKSLLRSSRKKQKLYNKFLKNRTLINETKYKKYKYEFNRLVFNKKQNYYQKN